MATENYQLKNEIQTNHQILNDKIDKGFEEFDNYSEVLKDERFEEILNETEEDAINRAEGIYDRLDELLKRNQLANANAKETVEILNKMTDLFNEIVNKTEEEKVELVNRNNELIDKILNLEQRKINELIDQNPKKKRIL